MSALVCRTATLQRSPCNYVKWNLAQINWHVDAVQRADLQSLSVAINEGLEEGFVVGDRLQDVSVCRHVADRPLAQPSAAQTENVAEGGTDRFTLQQISPHGVIDRIDGLTCQVCG